MGDKDKYRGADFRLSAILVHRQMKPKFPSEVSDLTYSLIEISRLVYQPALKRSPKSILRLYTMSFLHSVRCKQIFGQFPKLGKFYGEYYHSILDHFAFVQRIIAPSSLHTESEERLFGTFRLIGLATSGRGVDSVRDIGIVR